MQATSSILKKLAPLYIVIFIGFLGYALMITIFTPMILHPDHTHIHILSQHKSILLGILLCLYPLGQLFGCSILGALSDQFGRKQVLVVSLAVTCLCYLLMAFAIYHLHIIMLMIVLFITGLAEGNIVIAQSSIADLVAVNHRSQYFGYINVSIGSAYILGPLVGGKLAAPSLAAWFNYATPFAAVFVLLAITLLWILFYWQDTSQAIRQTPQHYFESLTNLKNVFTDRKRRYLFLVNFLIYLALFGFFRSYPMYLVAHFHMHVSQESEFIAWVAVPIIMANLGLTAKLSQYFSAKIITLSTALLTGLFLIIILIPAHVSALWITLFLAGFSIALCMPASCSMISQVASPIEQGQVMGNNQSIQVGAEAVSGLLAGMLVGVMVGLPLIFFAGVSFLAAVMLYFKRQS